MQINARPKLYRNRADRQYPYTIRPRLSNASSRGISSNNGEKGVTPIPRTAVRS